MKNFKPRIHFITGAASGIGLATAELLVEQGHKVVLADINATAAQAAADRLGPQAMALGLDICSGAQWTAALDETWQRMGGLDVLINNAAVVHTGFARDVSIERHEHTLATNFMGAVKGMLEALARFKAQGHGHLVTICSATSFIPYPGIASYAAAKHALRAFHHAVAIEERHSPVAFSIVHPSSTETPMLDKEAEDDAMALAFAGTSVSPRHVAELIAKAIARKSVEVIIPQERARIVRSLGTSPRNLLKMVERNEIVGREKLALRRQAAGQAAR